MKSTITVLIYLCLGFSLSAMAEEFFPSVIYQLDQRFSHHAIVVEKSTHHLYLYEYQANNPKPKLIKKFQIATGKMMGDKGLQGDKKTPEGIYQFQRFHSSEELISKYGDTGLIYGAGAFTLNYPNEIDRREGKTGGGIWLHSTDDDSRVSKGLDSRGCVVAIDADLKEISQYIDLSNTPTIIVQNLHFLAKETWEKNKDDIFGTVNQWMQAWQNKDLENYISSYSRSEFSHSKKGRFQAYKNYKRRIFAKTDRPIINFSNVSILSNADYAVVTMVQNYQSKLIQDIGKKTLYLKKDDKYQWKIVAELFNKLEEKEFIAFTPSMRFFNKSVTNTKSPAAKEMENDSESI